MSEASLPTNATAVPTKKRARWVAPVVLAVLLLILYWNTGFYTIQPIGALPQGSTTLVWRASGEPFFNSADATCLRIQRGVSLFCRMAAIGRAPTDRVILRLPYQQWAYLQSTGGLTFER